MPLSPALMLDTSKMVEMYNDKMKKNNKKSILLAHWALNDGTSRREGIASNRMTLSFNCWINIIFLAIFYHLRNSMDSVLCSSQCLCALALNEQIHYIEVVKWPLGTISFIFIYYYLSSWSAATSERAHQRHGNWLNAYQTSNDRFWAAARTHTQYLKCIQFEIVNDFRSIRNRQRRERLEFAIKCRFRFSLQVDHHNSTEYFMFP